MGREGFVGALLQLFPALRKLMGTYCLQKLLPSIKYVLKGSVKMLKEGG